MVNFPAKARVGRNMPKESFYKHLNLNSELKEKFVTDLKRIVLEFKLTPETLNLEKDGEINEILVLSLELKKKEIDYRILENIARQNNHKLIFLLKFQEQGQLAVYYAKLYKSGWKQADNLKLEARGLNLDRTWEGFIEQIALKNAECRIKNTELGMQNAELSLDEKLKKQEMILKLQKEIDKLERLSRKEKQPKKKFELYTEMKRLQKLLVNIQGEN